MITKEISKVHKTKIIQNINIHNALFYRETYEVYYSCDNLHLPKAKKVALLYVSVV